MDEIGDDPGKSKRFGDPPFPAAQAPNQAGGRFAMFPLWAASVPLTSTARRVYDAISGSANGSWGKERSVRLSLKMIAVLTGIPRHKIPRAIKELETVGLLRKQPQKAEHGGLSTTLYVLIDKRGGGSPRRGNTQSLYGEQVFPNQVVPEKGTILREGKNRNSVLLRRRTPMALRLIRSRKPCSRPVCGCSAIFPRPERARSSAGGASWPGTKTTSTSSAGSATPSATASPTRSPTSWRSSRATPSARSSAPAIDRCPRRPADERAPEALRHRTGSRLPVRPQPLDGLPEMPTHPSETPSRQAALDQADRRGTLLQLLALRLERVRARA